MAVGRIGADDDHDVASARPSSKSCVPAEVPKVVAQPVAGRRMADARAGIDIVVAEAGADQLLHQEGLFVGAARRGDAADRRLAVCRLDALELGGGVARSPRPRTLRARDR